MSEKYASTEHDVTSDLDLAATIESSDREPPTEPVDQRAGEDASHGDWCGKSLGHFEIAEKVGAGGMGAVWRARDTSLDRTVALKLLPRKLSDRPRWVTRFIREARAQARLSHPNVVPIYYIGREGDQYYFAMELVEGESLADRLDRGEATPWEEAVELTLGIARGLKQAHERGLVHRDIKPGNLLVTNAGVPRVADFGLARPFVTEAAESRDSLDEFMRQRHSRDDDVLSEANSFVGTPLYVAPEQARGESVDHRADIYALGGTLFHVIAGEPLFSASTAVAIVMKQVTEEPDLDRLPASVPAEVRNVLRRMLEKDPDDRFADYDELIEALEATLPQRAVPARMPQRAFAGAIDLFLLFWVWLVVTVVMFDLGPLPNETTAVIAVVLVPTLLGAYWGLTAAKDWPTLGQRGLSHRLVGPDGDRPGLSRIGLRVLLMVVPVLFPLAAYWLPVGQATLAAVALGVWGLALAEGRLREDRRMIHDRISGTRIVETTSDGRADSDPARSPTSPEIDTPTAAPPPESSAQTELLPTAPLDSGDVSNRSFAAPTDDVLGHFRLDEPLGAGGMGAVWRARDTSLDRAVAVKLLPRELMEAPTLRERFIREARSLARLSHPNVVPVYFIGQQRGQHYFAMELVPGESLADRIERGETTEWEEAFRIAIGIARGLKEAHARGVVHRDIKPGNILIGEDGTPRLADFGLAKPVDTSPADTETSNLGAEEAALTSAGGFVGTPHYASPEQGRGERVDHRTDVYGLGATLFHAICGEPLFRGDTSREVVHLHATRQPDLGRLPPEVPEDARSVLATMLEKDPDARYLDYEAVIEALERALPSGRLPASMTSRLTAGIVDAIPTGLVASALQGLESEFYWTWPLLMGCYLVGAGLTGSRTLGQMLTGQRLETGESATPGPDAVLIRTGILIVPVILFSTTSVPLSVVALTLWVVLLLEGGLRPDRRMLHDRLSATRVVKPDPDGPHDSSRA